MSELIRAGEKTWLMKGWANVGFYLQSENNVYVIDTGSEENSGEIIDQVLMEMGWNLKGVLITHGHEDHTAGNKYLQDKYGCQIFADAEDAVSIRFPEIADAEYYGGKPFRELLVPGIKMPESSVCLDFNHEDFPEEVEIISLPGHSRGNCAFIMPDGTMFTGDTYFIPDRKGRYLAYNYDIADVIDSLKKIRDIKAERYAPGHGDITESIEEIVDQDLDAIYGLRELILSMMDEPRTYDDMLTMVSREYGLKSNFGTYYLMNFIIRAFMNWMKDDGILSVSVEENRLLWRKNN